MPAMPAHTRAHCSMRAVAPRCALFAGADRHRRELDLATTRPPRRHDSTAATPRLTAATARRHQQQTATMQLISTLALATSAAALVAPAAPKASTKLDVATLKNPSSTEFAYGLPGNEIPGVPSSRFDFDPLGFAERASPAEMVKYREAELKHGRVAMLAITGMLFAEVWHPMLYAPSNVPAIFAFQGTCSSTLQRRSSRRCSSRSAPSSRRHSIGWEPTDFKMKDGYVADREHAAHKSNLVNSLVDLRDQRDGVVPWMGARRTSR